MTTLRFDHTNPPPLALRRIIAAQLMWLTAFSLNGDLEQPDDWDRYMALLHVELERLANGECNSDLGEAVAELLKRVTRDFSGDAVHPAILERVAGLETLKRNYFNCVDCGAAGRPCVGRPDNDYINFKETDDPGRLPAGACLGFLRALTNASLKCSTDLHESLGMAGLTSLPDEIVLKVCTDRIDAPVPVNGEMNECGDKVEITITWPETAPGAHITSKSVCEGMDSACEGMRMIPWLIFHEVFVHVFQARARPDCVGKLRIPGDCGFTEGAVDAAAIELLGPRLLRSDNFPKELSLLRDVFDVATEKYSRQRRDGTGKRPPKSNEAETHRIGRQTGWRWIWQPLTDMESRYRKPRHWAAEIVMRLNLELDRKERHDILIFMKGISTTPGNGPQSEMYIAFENYRDRKSDRTALLQQLKIISGSY